MRPDHHVEGHSTNIGCAGLILRLAWSVGGHFVLVSLGLLIAQRGRFSVLDLAFWLIVVLILVLRRMDILRFGPLTPEARADPLREWRRHRVFLVLGGGAVWALIHVGSRWLAARSVAG